MINTTTKSNSEGGKSLFQITGYSLFLKEVKEGTQAETRSRNHGGSSFLIHPGTTCPGNGPAHNGWALLHQLM